MDCCLVEGPEFETLALNQQMAPQIWPSRETRNQALEWGIWTNLIFSNLNSKHFYIMQTSTY